jgi:DNA-binding transcriptional regulator YiaG
VPDVHEGYIDLQQFERNEQQLKRSALAYGLNNRRTPPRQGPALLQGLVVCGVCGGRMTVRYHERAAGLVPDYLCIMGRMHAQKPLCQIIAGTSVDQAVSQRLLAAMTPNSIELALAVRAQLQARIDEANRLRYLQVERARHEADLAARRYMKIDPDNRLVATTLEADWNDKLRTLEKLRDEAQRCTAADKKTLDQATQLRLRALAEDFPAVFNDPHTAHRDRKRMVQLLIDDVTLVKNDKLHVHIRFNGGATESLALPLPQNAWLKRLTHPDVVDRIDQLLQHCDVKQVAEHLNAQGLLTGAQKPFDVDAVRWVCYVHGLKTPLQRLREAGKLTLSDMSNRIGVSESTLRDWARDGRLKAQKHAAKPQWLCDPIEQQPDTVQKLAAGRCKPLAAQPVTPDATPPALRVRVDQLLLQGFDDAAIATCLNDDASLPRTGAIYNAGAVRTLRRRCGLKPLWARLQDEGMMTTPQMAVCLGISISTVSDWLKKGLVRGRLCGKGARPRLLFAPLDEQPEPIRQRAAQRATMPKRPGLLSDAAAGRGAV